MFCFVVCVSSFFFFLFFLFSSFLPLFLFQSLSCVSPTSSYELPFIPPVCCRKETVALNICMFGFHSGFSPSICFPVLQSLRSVYPPSMYDRSPHLEPASVRSPVRWAVHFSHSSSKLDRNKRNILKIVYANRGIEQNVEMNEESAVTLGGRQSRSCCTTNRTS